MPPDVPLLALAVRRPERALWLATIRAAGPVIGGVTGYYIRYALVDQIRRAALELYHATETFERVGQLYRESLVVARGTAGFTPVPFVGNQVHVGMTRAPSA